LSADPTAGPPEQGAAPGEPTEQQIREAYEAELSRITATDMIGQSAVSLLNIGARRLGAPGGEETGTGSGRDLEQVRDAIDGARALLEILGRRIPAQELGPLRDALSRLQMAYAQEVQATPEQPGAGAPEGGQTPPQDAGAKPSTTAGAPQEGGDPKAGPGPAEASGRLWVPGR
jgi:hypothetical protein